MKDLGKGIAAVAIMSGATTAVAVAHETIGSEGCVTLMLISAMMVVAIFLWGKLFS